MKFSNLTMKKMKIVQHNLEYIKYMIKIKLINHKHK